LRKSDRLLGQFHFIEPHTLQANFCWHLPEDIFLVQ
jgi:hypothetical protein